MTGYGLLCKLNKANLITDVITLKNSEMMDLVVSDIPKEVDITKKQAAIIVHGYLKKILKEEDSQELSKAKVLKDLYDCRICVKHIEQVYIKGIIDPMIDVEDANITNLPILFGGNEVISEEEADKIVTRVFNKEYRRVVK